MRRCCNPDCNAVIKKCDGFTIGRDLLAFWEGKIPPSEVRELCGRCILFFVPGSQAFIELLAQID